ncbi:MAG TPA: peptidylprolyl isomerase [Spongiibacteraceae bacterium]|nr:peptidylprolyl isomerase [Spongiibacteraceae bacterium]
MQIGPNSVVSIHYELSNDAGEILDASAEGEPLVYLHGAHNIIPGLEKELAGKQIGDTLKVTVQPEEGYGVAQPELIQQVPRNAFPDPDKLTIGMRFSAQSDQGHISVVITELTDATATVDGNHPLAGVVLNFDVSIADVRAASDEEIAHGHVHTPGHHHH